MTGKSSTGVDDQFQADVTPIPTDRPLTADADGWIEWSGGENPVPGMVVEVRYHGGREVVTGSDVQDWSWLHETVNDDDDIIAFRIPADLTDQAGHVRKSAENEHGFGGPVAAITTPAAIESDHIPDASKMAPEAGGLEVVGSVGEASAYRVRRVKDDSDEWTLMHPEVALDFMARSGWESQPLYTHSDAAEKLVAELRSELAAYRSAADLEARCGDDAEQRAQTAESNLAVAVEAMRGVIEWDKDRNYRMPYRVRDPLYEALDRLKQKGGV